MIRDDLKYYWLQFTLSVTLGLHFPVDVSIDNQISFEMEGFTLVLNPPPKHELKRKVTVILQGKKKLDSLILPRLQILSQLAILLSCNWKRKWRLSGDCVTLIYASFEEMRNKVWM